LRNPEREQSQINNGTSFFVNTDEATGVFLRDVDKLFHQYHNLRLAIYNQYKDYLPDPVSRKDLQSYIDEQFVRLVKEFDIDGPVDFPGYVKTKLTYRVKHSYIKGEYRDRNRVFVTRNEFDIKSYLEKSVNTDTELDYYEVLEFALKDVELTNLEKEVLFLMLQELTDGEIEKTIKANHQSEKLSSSVVRETLKNMQEFIRMKLTEAQEF
jgi:benzoyl-CoA reductase/2-hydroxyglutaryl-CoA dehydratase subunit BcrC/BadD/HgdB